MTTAEFLQKYNNSSTGIFKAGQSRGIGSDDYRALITDIIATFNDVFMLSNFVPATTGTNTYAGSTPIAILSYVAGMKFMVKFSIGSTGASTLNLSAVGAKKIYINPTTQAGSGHIVASQTYLMEYDTTLDGGSGGFLMIGSGGGGAALREWNFPAGAFPTSSNVLYIATAESGSPGSDHVPIGTWFIANTPTPSGYSDFHYKL